MGVALTYSGDNTSSYYLHAARSQFNAMHDNRGLANVFNNLGRMCMVRSDLDSSIYWFTQSLLLFRELKDQAGIGATLNYIGIDYQYRGEYQKAVEYAIEGLRVRRETNDYRGTIYSMINAGNMYLEAAQYEQARALYLKSIDFAKQKGLPVETSSYQDMADLSMRTGNYAEAETWLKKANYTDPLLKGQLFYRTGRVDSALVYFEKSLMSFSHVQSRYVRARALNGLARLWLEKRTMPKLFFVRNRAYSSQIPLGTRKLKSEAAGLLARVYESKSDYRQALQYEKISRSLNDSVTGTEFQNKLAFFESKSAIDKEQARVKVLSAEKALQEQRTEEQRKTKNLILLTSVLALGAAVIVIMNIQRQKKRIQAQSTVIAEQRQRVEIALSELKSAQAQLIQKEKMASLGQLTTGIAHEIQNPLNFVNNFSELNAELIQEFKNQNSNFKNEDGNNLDLALLGDIESNLEKISFHGKRADAIVKGMLQHSRTSTGQKELTDINALADEYLRLSYYGFKARSKDQLDGQAGFNCELNTNFDSNLSKFNTVPQELGRVFLNIYNNAFYSVNEKKKLVGESYKPIVSVATRSINQKGDVEVCISDNGIGIPQKIRDNIFQPFFTTKPTGEGTGLGLSLSYEIIHAEGGEIKVESEDGEFSRFLIILPHPYGNSNSIPSTAI